MKIYHIDLICAYCGLSMGSISIRDIEQPNITDSICESCKEKET